MPNIFVKSPLKDDSNIKFYNILENPAFSIHGLIREDGAFVRLPEKVASTLNVNLHKFYSATTGGRVRFCTDSETVVIKAVMHNINLDSNTTTSGNAGFDLYERKDKKQYFLGNFMPPWNIEDGFTDFVKLDGKKERELVINFPMRSGVKELYIGLDESASLSSPEDYTVKTPAVFYGSSITMGLCVSRPGCTYESIMSQRLDFDFVNLGFGGGAKGEKAMAEYIAGLDMSLFVLDYDHNSPNPDHLKETQWDFYKTVREAHPDTPIVMMSRPKYYLSEVEKQRKAAIKENYEKGLAEGDKNLFFIPGDTIMNEFVRDCGTVDGIHPTDAGFFCMANTLMPLIKKLLSL